MYTYMELLWQLYKSLPARKGIVYRVLIRKAGTKPISKTFTSKKLAIQFAESINSNREFFEAYGYHK